MAKKKKYRKAKTKNPITRGETSGNAAAGAFVGVLVGALIATPLVFGGVLLFAVSDDSRAAPVAPMAALFGIAAVALPIVITGGVIGARRNAPKKAKSGAAWGAGLGGVLGFPLLGVGPVFSAPVGAYFGAEMAQNRKKNGRLYNPAMVKALTA